MQMKIIPHNFPMIISVIILMYSIMPKHRRWFVILAGNAMFYAASGDNSLSAALAVPLLPYFISLRIWQNRAKQSELAAHHDT